MPRIGDAVTLDQACDAIRQISELARPRTVLGDPKRLEPLTHAQVQDAFGRLERAFVWAHDEMCVGRTHFGAELINRDAPSDAWHAGVTYFQRDDRPFPTIHVAPHVLELQDDGSIAKRVLDPLLADHPISDAEWAARWQDRGRVSDAPVTRIDCSAPHFAKSQGGAAEIARVQGTGIAAAWTAAVRSKAVGFDTEDAARRAGTARSRAAA